MLILADAGYAITYGYRKETYIMKKKLSIILTLIMVLTMGITVSAAEDSSLLNNELTSEQRAVIEAFENNVVSDVDVVGGRLAKAAATGYRGSLYRGSVLAWSEDFIEWISNGSSITSSTGWQDSGFIFPNIVREGGISKHSSSSSSVTYRAEKTIGAGVVTPWGDVTVYNSDFTDFLKGTASGGFDTWQ